MGTHTNTSKTYQDKNIKGIRTNKSARGIKQYLINTKKTAAVLIHKRGEGVKGHLHKNE